MAPSHTTVSRRLAVVPSAKAEAERDRTPLQICLEQGLAQDEVAERVLTRRQYATWLNVRIRQLVLREQELRAA